MNLGWAEAGVGYMERLYMNVPMSTRIPTGHRNVTEPSIRDLQDVIGNTGFDANSHTYTYLLSFPVKYN